jgi:hypothetical protein
MAKVKNDKELKLVKKSKVLLVTVRCADEYFNDCNFAVLKLTKKVLEKVSEAKSIREIAGNSEGLYKITYWSPLGYDNFFFVEDEEDLGEELASEAFDNSDQEIQYLNGMPEPKGDMRIECEMMHVYDDGIAFDCYLKNTNTKLYTERIPFSEFGLQRIIKND